MRHVDEAGGRAVRRRRAPRRSPGSDLHKREGRETGGGRLRRRLHPPMTAPAQGRVRIARAAAGFRRRERPVAPDRASRDLQESGRGIYPHRGARRRQARPVAERIERGVGMSSARRSGASCRHDAAVSDADSTARRAWHPSVRRMESARGRGRNGGGRGDLVASDQRRRRGRAARQAAPDTPFSVRPWSRE